MQTSKLRPLVLLTLLHACSYNAPDDGSGGSTAASAATDDTSASEGKGTESGEGESAGPGEMQLELCSRKIIALTRDGVTPDCQNLVNKMEEVYPGTIENWVSLTAIRDGLCLLDLAETIDTDFMAALGELVHVTEDCAPVVPIAEEVVTECSSAAGSALLLARQLMGGDDVPDAPTETDTKAEIHVFDGASFVCDTSLEDCLLRIENLGPFTFKETSHLRSVATALYNFLGPDASRTRVTFHNALEIALNNGGVGQQGTRGQLLLKIHELLDQKPASAVSLALLPIGYLPGAEQQELDPVRIAMEKLAERMPIITGSGNKNIEACDPNTGPTFPGGFACGDPEQPLCSRLLAVGALGLDGMPSATTRYGGMAPLLGPGFVVVGDEFNCQIAEGSSIGSAHAAALGTRVLLRAQSAGERLGEFLYGTGTALDLREADLPIAGMESPVPRRLNECAALNLAESDDTSTPRTCVAPKDPLVLLLAKLSSELFAAWIAVRNATFHASCFSWFSPLPLVAEDAPSSEACFSPQEHEEKWVSPLPPRGCFTCGVRVDPDSSTSAQVLITMPDLSQLPDYETPSCWVDLETPSGTISAPLDSGAVRSDMGTVFTVEHDLRELRSATLVCEASGIELRFNVPILLGKPLTTEDVPISDSLACKNALVQDPCEKLLVGCRPGVSPNGSFRRPLMGDHTPLYPF